MRSIIASFAVVAALGVASPVPAAEGSALEAVEKTVDEVLVVLQNGGLSCEQRLRSIEEIVYRRFDVRTISRLVLGRQWKALDDAQKAEYVAEFKAYLSSNYGSRLQEYGKETVEILGTRSEPRGDVVVKTKIVGGNIDDTRVDYRLRQREGQWRVIDFTIEGGISAVRNLGEQFSSVLSRGGMDNLLATLREKNEADSGCGQATS